MPTIREFLCAHGLEKYVGVFEENEITPLDLPDLSDDDLKDMGLALGPRRRLQRLAKDAPTLPSEAQTAQTPDTEADDVLAWSRNPENRRPVTILVADIVGSTSLTENLDPEEAHAGLYGAIREIGADIESHQGHVCRFMGDGLMAVFGLPKAFEAQTANACFAALAMQRTILALASRKGMPAIKLRIGIHAGEVLALHVGTERIDEWDVAGPAVALATRMEQNAEPGTVLLSESTYLMVDRQFEGSPVAAVAAKGFAEPVPSVRLERERRQATFSSELAAAPFVGREAELAQAQAAIRVGLEHGVGRTIMVTGEAGAGKTHFAEHLINSAVPLGCTVHRGFVLEFGEGRGQTVIPTLVRSALEAGASALAERDPIAAAKHAVPTEDLPFVNALLGVPNPPDATERLTSLGAREREAGLIRTFVQLLTATCQRGPQLILVEDAHWASDVALKFLSGLMSVCAQYPLILVVTSRPRPDGWPSSWQQAIQQSPTTSLSLNPLRADDSRAVALAFGIAEQSVIDACVVRSGGNPLFLVELLRLADRGVDERLPTSVQTIAAARLDTLAENDRLAAQAASILGERFAVEPLLAMLDQDDYDVSTLVNCGLVREDGIGYRFAHALIMEGVLASLLNEQRQTLHRAAAQWFAERDVVLYARHLERSNDNQASKAYAEACETEFATLRFASALELAKDARRLAQNELEEFRSAYLMGECLVRLGEMTRAADAYTDAYEVTSSPREQLLAALGFAEAVEDASDADSNLAIERLTAVGEHSSHVQDDLEFVRMTRLSRAHTYLGNYDQGEMISRRAVELSRAAEAHKTFINAVTANALVFYQRASFITCYELLTEALEVAERQGLEREQVECRFRLCISAFYCLRLDEAIEHYDWTSNNAARTGAARAVTRVNDYACRVFAEVGDWQRMRESVNRLRQVSEQQASSREALSWVQSSLCAYWSGEEGALADAETALEISSVGEARRIALPWALAVMGAVVGLRSGGLEYFDKARALLRDGVWTSHNHLHVRALLLDEALLHGDFELALECADELKHVTRNQKLPWADAYIDRAKVLSAIAADPTGPQSSINVAELKRIQSKSGLSRGNVVVDTVLANLNL